jgi:ABC-2 type transport system permease protein
MLGTIYKFELQYHLKRPVTYLYVFVFLLLSFMITASEVVTMTGASAQVKINAPVVLAQLQLITVLVGQMMLTALVGTTVLRDYQVGAHELLFTTPISRGAYLGGRFLGVLTVMLLLHLAVPLGAWLGTLMPWVDQEKLLPFAAVPYLHPFFTLVIPSVMLTTAIFFAVGALSRNLFVIYTQGMALLVLYNIAGRVTGNLENRHAAALADPFALNALNEVTRYWTVAEQNTRLIPISGDILLNRIIWAVVAILIFALTFALFRFRSQGPTIGRKRKKVEDQASDSVRPALVAPVVSRSFTRAAHWRMFLSQARLTFTGVVRSLPFLALATVGLINLIMSSWYADSLYGQTTWPVTYTVAETVNGAFLLFFFIIVTLYAGEAVWQERQLKLDQVTDSLPVPTGVTVLGKFTGLGLVYVALFFALILAGVGIQATKGYHNYELGLYAQFLFGTTLPMLLQLTALAFAVHALVNQKYVGHVVMIGVFLYLLVRSTIGIEHQLFRFAEPPSFTYSDMNRFGPFVPNLALSALYWSGIAILLAAAAVALWVRGTPQRFRERMALARASAGGATKGFAVIGLVVALAAGGAIFYNTNVLNPYENSKAQRKQRVAYERDYRALRTLPRPRLVAAKVRADLEPERGAFTASGTFTFVNKTAVAIDSVVITTSHPEIRLDTLAWDRPATRVLDDSAKGTRIERFQPALAPGDTVRLRYRGRWEQKGFRNAGPRTVVVENGTFVNSEYYPVLGYQDGAEVASDEDRKKEKLPPRERMNSIDDEPARGDTYLNTGADWIDFEAVVSTAPDQIAIAPGYLQKEYTENGRRVFEYKMDKPIHNFFSFLSARYEVMRDTFQGVNLEIYYQKGHEFNLDRMMESMKASLTYFGTHFSPYQFRQVRILEFPRYAGFAQAFPNTVPYSESIGFILRASGDDDDLDMPFFVTAHEVAHQWWGHQVTGANVQGSTVFSEGLAEYSALTAMEKRFGQAHIQKFLAHELDRYLIGRTNETKREMPLMLVENQPYIHYNKGSLALYALRDYIGEDSMNAALSRFVKDKAFQMPPYTTAREFVGYLRDVTADSLKPVITDLFETITLWDFKTEDAAATRRPDGTWSVTLKVTATKFRADSLGNQTEIPIRDLVDIGVFGDRQPGNALGKPLLVEKRWITAKETTIELVVPEAPKKAGIDPYNKLIDRAPKDNVKTARTT